MERIFTTFHSTLYFFAYIRRESLILNSPTFVRVRLKITPPVFSYLLNVAIFNC